MARVRSREVIPRTTRFAPSPTGHLHLGHAYSALLAEKMARESGGHFILRIEDIDPTRCKPEFTEAIIEDLFWLGLTWEQPVRIQSQHLADYTAAADRLRGMGVLYPCFCTRREVMEEATRAGNAPHADDEAVVYAGTCRHFSPAQQQEMMAQRGAANWRLDIKKAMEITGPLHWHELERGEIAAQPEAFGDVVLARKDVPTSYHLSVVVDDYLQGINLVTRGMDLYGVTAIHRVLQQLLGYDAPDYHHHELLTDPQTGRRFAKRDQSVTLRALRQSGLTADDVRHRIGMADAGQKGGME